MQVRMLSKDFMDKENGIMYVLWENERNLNQNSSRFDHVKFLF